MQSGAGTGVTSGGGGAGGGGGSHGGGSAGGTGDDEAPKDPGANIHHQSYTEKDYEGN